MSVKKKYPEAVKRKAVEDFNSGKKSAQELADELVTRTLIEFIIGKHYFQRVQRKKYSFKILMRILNFSVVLLRLKWKIRSLREP